VGSAEAVRADFRRHVLDQVLRERIRRETEGVRNAIFALAFSNTGLVGPD
jgi:His-Xaa-Ser system protein HxsD